MEYNATTNSKLDDSFFVDPFLCIGFLEFYLADFTFEEDDKIYVCVSGFLSFI